MKKTIILALTAMACGRLVLAAGVTQVEATAERVNLRARPDIQTETVGQLNQGEKAVVKEIKGEWIEIIPPDAIDFWVHRDFVKDGKVLGSKVNVRAGAGVAYNIVGVLPKDSAVQQRGEFGEWLRIAPSTNISVWVSSQYVKVLNPQAPPAVEAAAAQPVVAAPAAAAAPEVATPPAVKATADEVVAEIEATAKTPPPVEAKPIETASAQKTLVLNPPVNDDVAVKAAEPVVPEKAQPIVATPPPVAKAQPLLEVVPPVSAPEQPAEQAVIINKLPDTFKLLPVEGQGQKVEFPGEIGKVGLFTVSPTPYRLVAHQGNQSETTCYLWGNEKQLSDLRSRPLLIRGRKYWVQGSRLPVVAVDEIVLTRER